MKLNPRVTVPIALAITIALCIGGVLLWHIKRTVLSIESAFNAQHVGSTRVARSDASGNASDALAQSEALTLLRQGEMFELKGIWAQAEEKYEASVDAGAGVLALRKLAMLQLQRRKYEDATETIKRMRQAGGDAQDVMFLEGILALRRGNEERASAIFQEKPEAAESQYGMGLLAIAGGDHEAAKQLFMKVSQGNNLALRTSAGTILRAYEEFALFPDGQDIHRQTLVAHALATVFECEAGLAMVADVVQIQSRYRDAWIVKGYCEFMSDRIQEALASLEQAYSLDPEKPEIQYFLARTHAALGDPQNAVTFLQYAILNGFQPERDARQLLAEYAKELGNGELALEQLKILALDPASDIDMTVQYVELALSLHDHALDALSLSKAAILRWSEEAEVLALAARSALAAGLPDDARSFAERALKIDPKNKAATDVVASILKKSR